MMAKSERLVADPKNNGRTADDRHCLVGVGQGAGGAQTGEDQAAPA